jgi:hypothetical protein
MVNALNHRTDRHASPAPSIPLLMQPIAVKSLTLPRSVKDNGDNTKLRSVERNLV